jgi:hypothetical protein
LKSLFLFVAIVLCCASPGKSQNVQIAAGSTVYIEPMNGFETYLASAFAKKKYPL